MGGDLVIDALVAHDQAARLAEMVAEAALRLAIPGWRRRGSGRGPRCAGALGLCAGCDAGPADAAPARRDDRGAGGCLPGGGGCPRGRQPVAQITGRRLFWGQWFRVTRDTLDPRPDTEALARS